MKAHRTDRDVPSDLMDNVHAQLNNTCHAVSNAAHSFALLRRSLEKESMQVNRATIHTNSSTFPSSLKAERSDLAKNQTNPTAGVAGKNSYARVTCGHEVSVNDEFNMTGRFGGSGQESRCRKWRVRCETAGRFRWVGQESVDGKQRV